MSLVHLEDPENAKAAYDQALHFDAKDPAIPLNYAVLLFNQDCQQEASVQMHNFEARVEKLKKLGLDADPDVRYLIEVFVTF